MPETSYTWLDAVKDFLGAVGPILIALPWFGDFFLRKRLQRMAGVKTSGKAGQLKDEMLGSFRQRFAEARWEDLAMTLLGLACIFASFLIALVNGLFRLV